MVGRLQEIQQLEWLGSLISTFYQVWFLFYFIFNESPFARQLVSTVSVSIIKCSRPSRFPLSRYWMYILQKAGWVSVSKWPLIMTSPQLICDLPLKMKPIPTPRTKYGKLHHGTCWDSTPTRDFMFHGCGPSMLKPWMRQLLSILSGVFEVASCPTCHDILIPFSRAV